jgi:hypothetical protein
LGLKFFYFQKASVVPEIIHSEVPSSLYKSLPLYPHYAFVWFVGVGGGSRYSLWIYARKVSFCGATAACTVEEVGMQAKHALWVKSVKRGEFF